MARIKEHMLLQAYYFSDRYSNERYQYFSDAIEHKLDALKDGYSLKQCMCIFVLERC